MIRIKGFFFFQTHIFRYREPWRSIGKVMGNVAWVVVLLDSKLVFEDESIVPLFGEEIACVLSFLKILEGRTINWWIL